MVSTWSPGAKGQCQRCGFKYKLTQLRKEWTGLKVCHSCWDPRPQDRTPAKVTPEGLPKPNASPESPPRGVARGVTADAGPLADISTTFGEQIAADDGRTADSGDLIYIIGTIGVS